MEGAVFSIKPALIVPTLMYRPMGSGPRREWFIDGECKEWLQWDPLREEFVGTVPRGTLLHPMPPSAYAKASFGPATNRAETTAYTKIKLGCKFTRHFPGNIQFLTALRADVPFETIRMAEHSSQFADKYYTIRWDVPAYLGCAEEVMNAKTRCDWVRA